MRITKDPDIRKKEIVDLATKLFLEKGFEKVSVRGIIDKTDSSGSPGMFYYYFKSKNEIYTAVIDQIVDEQIERRQALLKRSDSKNESAENTIKSLLELIQTDAEEYQKFSLQSANRELLEQVSKRLILSEQSMLQKLVDRMLDSHILPTSEILNFESSKYVTEFIIYGVNGILMNLKPTDDGSKALEYVKEFINRILNLNL